MADTPPEADVRLDLVGTALSALGLGLIVFGILRSGEWGFVQPKPGGPEWLGLSPAIWLSLAGGVVVWIFVGWENRLLARDAEPLVDPAILRNPTLRGGLTSFFFQYLLQAGLFFTVPLFLSVALGLSAIATGVRLLPLSITLLLAAAGHSELFPHAFRPVGWSGCTLALFAGISGRSPPWTPAPDPKIGDLADAARRPRCRRVGVPARERHGVIGIRCPER